MAYDGIKEEINNGQLNDATDAQYGTGILLLGLTNSTKSLTLTFTFTNPNCFIYIGILDPIKKSHPPIFIPFDYCS